jgi:hypothetical protein
MCGRADAFSLNYSGGSRSSAGNLRPISSPKSSSTLNVVQSVPPGCFLFRRCRFLPVDPLRFLISFRSRLFSTLALRFGLTFPSNRPLLSKKSSKTFPFFGEFLE